MRAGKVENNYVFSTSIGLDPIQVINLFINVVLMNRNSPVDVPRERFWQFSGQKLGAGGIYICGILHFMLVFE